MVSNEEQQVQEDAPGSPPEQSDNINETTVAIPESSNAAAAPKDGTVTTTKKKKDDRHGHRLIRIHMNLERRQYRPARCLTSEWSGGDREDKYISKHHAEGRCNIAKDSGYTKADRVPGSYFCLFFARGLCPHGHHCEYLHRLPTIHDIFNPNIDSFGRDKHSDYRDDMGGVGSFMRQNRTLYIGRIHVTDEIEEIVARHFAEWGQIERIRVLNSRGVAFVTYVNEANAQFGKEAMAHQSLDHSEILNVRWATQDPNPLAQARDKRRIEEQAAEAIRRALPADYVAELEGKDPEVKKRRKIEGSFGLQGFEAPEDVWYNRGIEVENSGGQGYGQIDAPPGDESGILGGATLAALKQYAEKKSTAPKMNLAITEKPGPLVAYGSDDDSD